MIPYDAFVIPQHPSPLSADVLNGSPLITLTDIFPVPTVTWFTMFLGSCDTCKPLIRAKGGNLPVIWLFT